MHLFAQILRAMKPLDPAVLASLIDPGSDDGDSAPPESDIDNNAPRTPRGNNRTPESSIARSASSSTGSSRSSRVRGAVPYLQVARNSSANTWAQQSFRTAPTTPKSRRTAVSRSSSSASVSGNSFAQTRNPYPVSQASSASSMRSDAGSVVIRLAEDEEGEMPYVLNLTETRSSAG